MASLTDNFIGRRNKPGAGRPVGSFTVHPPLGPPLRDKLNATRHQIEQLGPKIERLALAVVQGEIDQSVLAAENAALDALKTQERTLAAALVEAERVDRARMMKRRSEQRTKEMGALTKGVADRDAAAKDLASAIAAAAQAYRRVLTANDTIIKNIPFGSELRLPDEFSAKTIRRLVAEEMARASCTPGTLGDDVGALPGSHVGTILMKHQPGNIAPLHERIAQSGAGLVRVLMGELESNPAGLPPASAAPEREKEGAE